MRRVVVIVDEKFVIALDGPAPYKEASPTGTPPAAKGAKP
jgi:hypothetical protein